MTITFCGAGFLPASRISQREKPEVIATRRERNARTMTRSVIPVYKQATLACAVPVRRDVNGGWYFQVIEVIGLFALMQLR
jgi:hypothetical protein